MTPLVEEENSFECAKLRLGAYYGDVYGMCQGQKKAKKDVVGKGYEEYLKKELEIEYPHLRVATSEEESEIKKIFKGYDGDLYILDQQGELLAIIEAKGHYLDTPMLKRCLFNAMETMQTALNKGLYVPDFILSCPTNYSRVDEIIDDMKYVRPEVLLVLREKFKFLSLCEHGRIPPSVWLKTPENPLKMSRALWDDQRSYYSNLKRGFRQLCLDMNYTTNVA